MQVKNLRILKLIFVWNSALKTLKIPWGTACSWAAIWGASWDFTSHYHHFIRKWVSKSCNFLPACKVFSRAFNFMLWPWQFLYPIHLVDTQFIYSNRDVNLAIWLCSINTQFGIQIAKRSFKIAKLQNLYINLTWPKSCVFHSSSFIIGLNSSKFGM
jgi:hypothetical protein